MNKRPSILLAPVLFLFSALSALPLAAVEAPSSGAAPEDLRPLSVPGRSLGEMLAIARTMNPGLAAAALDAHAAQLRVGAAGRYPDPMLRAEFEDITGNGNRYAPDTLGRVKYTVEQTIPLWGKLGLERKMALAEAEAAAGQRRAVESELAARIKFVFANAYATEQAIRINEELLDTVGAIARVAESRYGQGAGGQQDAVMAEVERGRVQADLARLEGERRTWAAQLNALLNRPISAPLAPPVELRPLPAPDALGLAVLVERARRASPELAVDAARITAGERTAELVQRTWYPDVTLGLSVFDKDDGNDREFGGYEAMVAFDVPLQWGLRRAREGEAQASLAASRARREATDLTVQSQIAAAHSALVSARHGERILREVNIPQTKVVLQSALAGYQLGRVDLPTVLLAEQAVLRVNLDRVELLTLQQIRLAEIERAIGEEL